ncbi:MAG TPA: L,D-transpeptidase, partial [Pyrinomonadaceae bacterium]
MSILFRVAGAIFALALTLGGAGCVTQPPVNTANNTTTTNTTNAQSPAAPPEISKTNANASQTLPVTLPLLDAFFQDETFAPELKTKLQLTDEQIEKLRRTAREETGRLRETDTGDYSGTTSAARARAAEQIKAVIGDEKAQQLTAFLSERWNGAGEEGGDANIANSGNNSGNTSAANSTNANASHASKNQFNAVPSDTRIVVNAPAYRMDVFDAGRLVKSYKVGIGYPEFPLPS